MKLHEIVLNAKRQSTTIEGIMVAVNGVHLPLNIKGTYALNSENQKIDLSVESPFNEVAVSIKKNEQESQMTQKLDDKELVSFKEMMVANSIQIDAVCQLLIEKGIITEQEFYSKLKKVHADYTSKRKS